MIVAHAGLRVCLAVTCTFNIEEPAGELYIISAVFSVCVCYIRHVWMSLLACVVNTQSVTGALNVVFLVRNGVKRR